MNAITFNTLLPHLLIRQSHAAAPAPAATARHKPERIVTFTAPVEATADAMTQAASTSRDFVRRDLAPVLRLATWIFQPVAMAKNVALRVEAPDIGLYATCHEVRIQRVLEKLISNALRHAPENSVVTVAARVENGRLGVWVEDAGPGVPLAEQETLFEATEFSFAELALGVNESSHSLATCQNIVTAHGGEILMYNRVEGGAHFEFRLPSPMDRRDDSATANPATAPAKSGRVTMFPRMKISA